MDWVEQYQSLSNRDKEEFSRILNKLISSTFLVKSQEQSRRDYYFVERHLAMIQGYLRMIDWEIFLDRAQGVCHLTNRTGSQRLALNTMESVLLLILRLLYEEQRKQLNLTQDVVVLTQDLQTKYMALKIRNKPLEKKLLRENINLFKRFNLVEVLDRDVTDPECRIKIYPSILFAVRVDSLAALHNRLEAYQKDTEQHEDDENGVESAG